MPNLDSQLINDLIDGTKIHYYGLLIEIKKIDPNLSDKSLVVTNEETGKHIVITAQDKCIHWASWQTSSIRTHFTSLFGKKLAIIAEDGNADEYVWNKRITSLEMAYEDGITASSETVEETVRVWIEDGEWNKPINDHEWKNIREKAQEYENECAYQDWVEESGFSAD